LIPTLVIGSLSGVVLSAFLPLVAIPALRRLKIVDLPNERSSHTGVALRGLGVVPWCGFAIAAAVSLSVTGPGRWLFTAVTFSALAIGLVGFLEDYVGLSVRARILLQVLVGSVFSAALMLTNEIALIGALISSAFFVAYVNVTNFMDGIDANSGMHGIAAGLGFAVSGAVVGQEWLLALGLLVAGSFGTFLFWNVGKSRRFLGDVGSYLLGGVVAAGVVAAVASGVPAWAVISPLLPYIADSVYTLVRRVVERKRWSEAHREHLYQRLVVVLGWSHLSVASIYFVFSVALTLIGAWLYLAPNGGPAAVTLQVVLLITFVVSAEIGLKRSRGNLEMKDVES
jgi:UDP-N-acetylmuramyl pentapeptide phosphotransferase/UDP-N-acetylglucosamine-1-phosphate transferase